MTENNDPTKTEIEDYRWAMETVDAVHEWPKKSYSDAEVISALLKPISLSGETALQECRRFKSLSKSSLFPAVNA